MDDSNPYLPPDQREEVPSNRLPFSAYLSIVAAFQVPVIMGVVAVRLITRLFPDRPLLGLLYFAVPIVGGVIGYRDWRKHRRIHDANLAVNKQRQQLWEEYGDHELR